ncbi:hypothetical protein JCM10213_008123 [Rhodosporidiobolus nylandii]
MSEGTAAVVLACSAVVFSIVAFVVALGRDTPAAVKPSEAPKHHTLAILQLEGTAINHLLPHPASLDEAVAVAHSVFPHIPEESIALGYFALGHGVLVRASRETWDVMVEFGRIDLKKQNHYAATAQVPLYRVFDTRKDAIKVEDADSEDIPSLLTEAGDTEPKQVEQNQVVAATRVSEAGEAVKRDRAL